MASGQPFTHRSDSQQMKLQSQRRFRDQNRRPFPEILYEAINYAEQNQDLSSILCWTRGWSGDTESPSKGNDRFINDSFSQFIISNTDGFMKEIASKYFPNNSSFRSIERMLGQWQFRRHKEAERTMFGDSDRKTLSKRRIYSHSKFRKGRPDMLKLVERKRQGYLASEFNAAVAAAAAASASQQQQQQQQPIATTTIAPSIEETSVTTGIFSPSSVGQFSRFPKETAGRNLTTTMEVPTKLSDEAELRDTQRKMSAAASSTAMDATSPLPATKNVNQTPVATTTFFSHESHNQYFSSSLRNGLYSDIQPKCKPQLHQRMFSRDNFRCGGSIDSGFDRLGYLSTREGIGSSVDRIITNFDDRLGSMMQQNEQDERQHNERTGNFSRGRSQQGKDAIMPSDQFEDASTDNIPPIHLKETRAGQKYTTSQFEDADIDCNDPSIADDGVIENNIIRHNTPFWVKGKGGTADRRGEGEEDSDSIGSELII